VCLLLAVQLGTVLTMGSATRFRTHSTVETLALSTFETVVSVNYGIGVVSFGSGLAPILRSTSPIQSRIQSGMPSPVVLNLAAVLLVLLAEGTQLGVHGLLQFVVDLLDSEARRWARGVS
jgi:hypothetical protein